MFCELWVIITRLSTNHNFWRGRRAQGPSAYQPNTILLGQTSSQYQFGWPGLYFKTTGMQREVTERKGGLSQGRSFFTCSCITTPPVPQTKASQKEAGSISARSNLTRASYEGQRHTQVPSVPLKRQPAATETSGCSSTFPSTSGSTSSPGTPNIQVKVLINIAFLTWQRPIAQICIYIYLRSPYFLK